MWGVGLFFWNFQLANDPRFGSLIKSCYDVIISIHISSVLIVTDPNYSCKADHQAETGRRMRRTVPAEVWVSGGPLKLLPPDPLLRKQPECQYAAFTTPSRGGMGRNVLVLEDLALQLLRNLLIHAEK
jgi:hypothetical protein